MRSLWLTTLLPRLCAKQERGNQCTAPHIYRYDVARRRGSQVVKEMTERSLAPRIQASCYDDMPLSRLLFRYLWPFWLFHDANRGDRYARAAAYRHNRGMRVYLPAYLLRWLVSSVIALALTAKLGALSQAGVAEVDLLTLMAAGAGLLFACNLCVLFVTGYIYLYLGRHEG